MIQGTVNAFYEAVIPLTVQGPAGKTLDIQAVVDTGFSGFLTLQSALVAELGLPFVYSEQLTLAGDSAVEFDVHVGAVLWDDSLRNIEVVAAGRVPLVGMQMLDLHNLNIDVERGGLVAIRAKA